MNATETQLAVLSHKVESLHGDLTEMKTAMGQVASAITKLALIEERQAQVAANQERIFELIERIDGRVDALERTENEQARAATWVTNAVWAAAGVAAMFVAKTVGLL